MRLGGVMDRRLEAGWGQKIAWSVLVVVSLGLLSWIPFLYVVLKRKRRGDWIAFAAFAVATVVLASWAASVSDGPDNPVLGAYAVLLIVTAVVMLLFTVFDKSGTKHDAVNVAQPEGRQFL
jgi:drug/metabolite transporter (DMT)-like permease